MDIRVTGGSTLHRIWGFQGDGQAAVELLGYFTYSTDALAHAQLKIKEATARCFFDSIYIISNHNTGALIALKATRPERPEEEEETDE